MNNSESRLHDVFFYGLYMDPEILKSKNVEPRIPRVGHVKDYKLRLGDMATLLRDAGSKAYGMVYSLTHEELDRLYVKSGLDMYAGEALLVHLESDESIPALCCNLLTAPQESELNSEYKTKLLLCMARLNVPTSCV